MYVYDDYNLEWGSHVYMEQNVPIVGGLFVLFIVFLPCFVQIKGVYFNKKYKNMGKINRE